MSRIGRLIGCLGLVAVTGCSAAHRGRPVHAHQRVPAATAAPQATPTVVTAATTRGRSPHRDRHPDRVQAPRGLSVDQLAGQRVVYAYTGLRPPNSLLEAIRHGEAGGVIFFSWNIQSVPQIRGVIAKLQQASLASPLHDRLLMMTDQEGGEVRRLPGAPLLSEKQIGQSSRSRTLAGAAGRGAARELHLAGMNVNLAPVLDVYRQPGNFIDQYQRSYSQNPDTVAQLGSAFIAAQQAAGVAATAKHFPGLGAADTDQDTDLRPVTLEVPLGQLRHIDEVPYHAAITTGVKLVMISWAVYPALDPARPAGLSPVVIQGELRRRLGFRGVTITDAIGAGALTPFGAPSQTSVLAARAGADLILCTGTGTNDNTPRLGLSVMHAIAGAITHGQIPRSAAIASVSRILALRAAP